MSYRHVFVVRSVLVILRREVRSKPGRETGGPLVGYVAADGALVVTHAGGPGPRAEHRRFSVKVDGAHAQRFCDGIHHESEGRLDYVGDWHNHPGLSLRASAHDAEAMRTMAAFEHCPVRHPVSLIYRSFWEKFVVYVLTDAGELAPVPASLLEAVPASPTR